VSQSHRRAILSIHLSRYWLFNSMHRNLSPHPLDRVAALSAQIAGLEKELERVRAERYALLARDSPERFGHQPTTSQSTPCRSSATRSPRAPRTEPKQRGRALGSTPRPQWRSRSLLPIDAAGQLPEWNADLPEHASQPAPAGHVTHPAVAGAALSKGFAGWFVGSPAKAQASATSRNRSRTRSRFSHATEPMQGGCAIDKSSGKCCLSRSAASVGNMASESSHRLGSSVKEYLAQQPVGQVSAWRGNLKAIATEQGLEGRGTHGGKHGAKITRSWLCTTLTSFSDAPPNLTPDCELVRRLCKEWDSTEESQNPLPPSAQKELWEAMSVDEAVAHFTKMRPLGAEESGRAPLALCPSVPQLDLGKLLMEGCGPKVDAKVVADLLFGALSEITDHNMRDQKQQQVMQGPLDAEVRDKLVEL